MSLFPFQEILQYQKVRLFSWNMRLSSDAQQDGQILFLIKSRKVRSTATSNEYGFSHPISYNFPFNLESLSTKKDVDKLVYDATLGIWEFYEQGNKIALAKSISEFLVKNYSLGLHTSFSNPSSPKIIIVVEVNKTWVSRWFQDGGGVGMDEVGIFDYEAAEKEFIEASLRNLMRVPVLSLPKAVDGSEALGLTQVPGLHSFQRCDKGALIAGEEGACAICLEGYSGNSCFQMPCSHVFHGGCITRWLWRKRSCPMCRSRLS